MLGDKTLNSNTVFPITLKIGNYLYVFFLMEKAFMLSLNAIVGSMVQLLTTEKGRLSRSNVKIIDFLNVLIFI